MTWNQILGKFRVGATIGSNADGRDIEVIISEWLGVRDEAGFTLVNSMSIVFDNQEFAERTMQLTAPAVSDCSKWTVSNLEKKGEHSSIATLISVSSRYLYVYTIEITREV